MFEKRRDNTPDGPATPTGTDQDTQRTPADTFNTRNAAVIGSTIKIKGEVSGEENLLIEGKVAGSVELNGHDLTIGQLGEVDADLSAKTIKVEGKVTGDIKGAEKVIITKSGRVLGNIIAPRVTLEDGAKFKGSIDMDPGVDKPSAVAPKRAGVPTKPEAVEEKSGQSGG